MFISVMTVESLSGSITFLIDPFPNYIFFMVSIIIFTSNQKEI